MLNIVNRLNRQGGFTLIELALVLAILAVLTGAAAPYAATQVRNQAAEKTAREMLAIADAAKSYYVANTAWPASIATLQTAGYLPAAWTATNPFGNAYTISSATSLTVTTTVTSDIASAVSRLVPLGTITGGTSVAGVWPRPGQSSDLSAIHGLPSGAIVYLNGTSCTAAGLVDVTAARGRVIVGLPVGGTLGGTVNTAFTDLENRTHTHSYTDIPAHTHTTTESNHTHGVMGSFDGTGTIPTSYAASAGLFISGGGASDPLSLQTPRSVGVTQGSTTGLTINSTGVSTGTTQASNPGLPTIEFSVCQQP